MNRFESALANGQPLLLDGGLATQLEAQGHDLGTRLWSAALLRDDPGAIVDAHLAFLEAGANCIIGASYQASRQGFMSLGHSAIEADALIALSVELARRARDQYLRDHEECAFPPLVAASIGPYGAALHDGSEYTGYYGVSAGVLRDFHAPRLRLLDTAAVDVLACETIPDRKEAGVLSDLLADSKTPAWVSFTCRDARCISDGTPLREVAARFADHPRVLALGINCTAPHLLTPLIGELRAAAPRKGVVVYPNSGETYLVAENSWEGIAECMDYGQAAREWHAAGATLIGGCCRMTPRDIAAMRKALAFPAPPGQEQAHAG